MLALVVGKKPYGKSQMESTVEFALYKVQALLPVQSNSFSEIKVSLVFMVLVLPEKVSVP